MKWMEELIKGMFVTAPGPIFLYLAWSISIDYAQPITGQVTELTPRNRQKMHAWCRFVADMHYCLTRWVWIWSGNGWYCSISHQYFVTMVIGHCSHIMATSGRKWQGFTPHHRKHKLICKLRPIISPWRNTVQVFSLIYRIPNIMIIVGFCGRLLHPHRDPFMYAPSQWEMMLQCNVISHWRGAYTKWSLFSMTSYYEIYCHS